MQVGRIWEYWWCDRGEEPLEQTLAVFGESLIGLHAVNTSYDSGLLSLEWVGAGWEMIGKHAVSPPITKELIRSWPISHDAYCDEWYFFRSLPAAVEIDAICNWMGIRIWDWERLEFEGGLNLASYLSRYRPEFVVGGNEYTYVISRSELGGGHRVASNAFI